MYHEEKKMSNVIKFPTKNNSIPQTVEEVHNIIKANKIDSANEIVDSIFDNILGDISGFGFEFSNDDIYLKDLIMLKEVLKATIHRHIGEHHFLHEMIEQSVDTNDLPNAVDKELE